MKLGRKEIWIFIYCIVSKNKWINMKHITNKNQLNRPMKEEKEKKSTSIYSFKRNIESLIKMQCTLLEGPEEIFWSHCNNCKSCNSFAPNSISIDLLNPTVGSTMHWLKKHLHWNSLWKNLEKYFSQFLKISKRKREALWSV
jgi:ferredoxin